MMKPIDSFKTSVLAGAMVISLLLGPPAVHADEPVVLTPVAELPEKPDIEALTEELRSLSPEARRERLNRLREKYGAREAQRTPTRPAAADPRARLKRPYPDYAAYTNALAQARNPAARNIDPEVLLRMQKRQLAARLERYESLGTNAPVELAAKIEQLEELNRRIDERLKELEAADGDGKTEAGSEKSEAEAPNTGNPSPSEKTVSEQEENLGK